MEQLVQKIQETASFLKEKGFHDINIAVVLGTGLGGFIDHVKDITSIGYEEIPHFPEATVESHKGKLIFGQIADKKVLVMQGRFHYYEGYSMQEITFPIRVMKELGVKTLLLSNAAGGMQKNLRKGDLVLIDDHINLLPENPLRGLSDPYFGNRFVDMFEPYNAGLNKLIKKIANAQQLPISTGVYVAVAGPNLETRAEYKYLHAAGADVVGMSTVPEVIVANHVGIACAAVSVVTDECQPDLLKPVNIEEIIAVAGTSDKKLSLLFAECIRQY